MNDATTALKIIAYGIGFIIGLGLLLQGMGMRRAMKHGIYCYKEGMYIKDGDLVATKTPVYKDFKTGECYLGVTKVIKLK